MNLETLPQERIPVGTPTVGSAPPLVGALLLFGGWSNTTVFIFLVLGLVLVGATGMLSLVKWQKAARCRRILSHGEKALLEGRLEEALEAAQRARAIIPQNLDAVVLEAASLLRLARPSETLRLLARTEGELVDHTGVLRVLRAIALVDDGKPLESDLELTDALRAYPLLQEELARTELGARARLALGKKSAAEPSTPEMA